MTPEHWVVKITGEREKRRGSKNAKSRQEEIRENPKQAPQILTHKLVEKVGHEQRERSENENAKHIPR